MNKSLLFCAFLVAACTTGEAPAPVTSIAKDPEPLPAVEMPEAEPEVLHGPTLDSLSGLSPADIQNLIGAPSLVRRDDTVQIMLFETDGCVLEIIYREPDAEQPFKAEHIAARNTQGDDLDTASCLAAVYNSHIQ